MPPITGAKNINFHNGWIEVINRTGRRFRFMVLSNPKDQQDHYVGHPVWDGYVNAGASADLNNCCYAAGSYYMLTRDANPFPLYPGTYMTSPDKVIGSLRPRLCNRNGIPFGYAAVELYENRLVRIDTKCP